MSRVKRFSKENQNERRKNIKSKSKRNDFGAKIRPKKYLLFVYIEVIVVGM